MAGRFFILHKVTDFAPGYFENTAVESGCIQLGRRAGQYVDSGTYTSLTFTSEGFFNLIPSWNADIPKDTFVEMQVRVASGGNWSQWFGFGQFSPYSDRATPPPKQDEVATVDGDTLTLMQGLPAATRLQLRIFLRSQNPDCSPRVHLLAASTNAAQQMRQNEPAYNRFLELPQYACQNRDPSIGGRMGSATSLCMMMNRYGNDLLPEEIARTAYDSGAGHYNNLSFLVAVAGMHGFHSYASYNSIPSLRREVWQGRAVAAKVQYRAPALSEEDEQKDVSGLPPVLDGANRNSSGHLVAIHGFTRIDGAEYVVMNDPLCPKDEQVMREIPLATFAKIYTGQALFLKPNPGRNATSYPTRVLAQLSTEDNFITLCEGDACIVPDKLEELAPYTMCYTLSGQTAYASNAQRKFYYLLPDDSDRVPFDIQTAKGKRMTFYFIGNKGNIWVAEKWFIGDEKM